MVDRVDLARRLYDRRHTGAVVPYVQRSLPGWRPSEHQCHGNADYWSIRNPGQRAVRGWLVFDFSTANIFSGAAHFQFNAHSVNEDENGVLFDLTPSLASKRYPFLRHEGAEEEFISLVAENQIVELNHFLTDGFRS